MGAGIFAWAFFHYVKKMLSKQNMASCDFTCSSTWVLSLALPCLMCILDSPQLISTPLSRTLFQTTIHTIQLILSHFVPLPWGELLLFTLTTLLLSSIFPCLDDYFYFLVAFLASCLSLNTCKLLVDWSYGFLISFTTLTCRKLVINFYCLQVKVWLFLAQFI
jgi:hypothetical protein